MEAFATPHPAMVEVEVAAQVLLEEMAAAVIRARLLVLVVMVLHHHIQVHQ
jgi:hypothetical protein